MTELPRRRLLDRLGAAPTVLSVTSTLRGDIDTKGALLVNGQIVGNGSVGGELAIASGAHWQGEVRCANAVIAGGIAGTLVVSDKLEIGASAVIRGKVTARRIAIARGAIVEGDLLVTGAEPVVEFEEKRAAVTAA